MALNRAATAARGARGPAIDAALAGAAKTRLGSALGLRPIPAFTDKISLVKTPWEWTKTRVGGPALAMLAGKGSGISTRDRLALGYLAGKKYGDVQNLRRYLAKTGPVREHNRNVALTTLLAAGGGGLVGAAVDGD